jgi:hypothetical protein
VQASRYVWRWNDDAKGFATFSRIDLIGLVGVPNLLPFGFGGLCVVLGGKISCHGMRVIDLPLSTIVAYYKR